MEKKKNNDMKMDVQKKRIEKYIKYNYEDINIITFTDSKRVPTGGTYIHGYVNNDKKLSFTAWLTPEVFQGQFSYDLDGLGKKIKFDKEKSIENIEREE
ncbi:DUF1433 domain-containing protein [Enterococcus wangshanyuanii]|uniref:DUF1433 domain-containing protein n=1 Tax=Enterococcus wangshanyuanii TaxID=2005703 RepID=A0ABQ1PEU4_9ENTE|nr:DUF1433 domain-containing protein [Enterococcus wangshanyuanii]GGC95746.1 hypothetical protein GCM10011573_26810 [Enterococcus wangshanyuanii]